MALPARVAAAEALEQAQRLGVAPELSDDVPPPTRKLFPREEGTTLDEMLLTTCKPGPGCIVTVINKSNSNRVVKIQFEKAYEQSVVVTPPGENPRRVNFTHVEGKLLDLFWKEDASGGNGELLLYKRKRVRCYAEHVESVEIR